MELKQTPEDFRVEEIIDVPKKVKNGKYTYFWLEKRNYTTIRALKHIARALRISKRRLHFSGTKDKFAITKQLISAINVPAAKLEELDLKDLTITPEYHTGRKRITLGSHRGNRFEVVVRDLSADFDRKMLKTRAETVSAQGFPNYFDEQRFSTNNAEIGKALVLGYLQDATKAFLSKDKKTGRLAEEENWSKLLNQLEKSQSIEKAVVHQLLKNKNDYAAALRRIHKKLRKLFVHSYQSLLFNRALSSIIKNPTGKLEVAGQKLNIGVAPNKKLKLPGYKTKLGSSAYDRSVRKQLGSDTISLEHFKCQRVPGLASKGETRRARVKPRKLKIGGLKDDELNEGKKKVTVSFELGNGVYATLLVKILFQ